MGKFQRIRKVRRELKELKVCFPSLSLKSIKEEASPLILAKITNYLVSDGTDGLEACIALLNMYHITNDMFKEHILDLQSKESITKRFEKLTPSLKGSLTRKLNERNKTSVAHKRKKENASTEADKVKYDEEGNIREVFADNEEEEDEDGVSIKSNKTKPKKPKTTKAKDTKETKETKETKAKDTKETKGTKGEKKGKKKGKADKE
jgi:hypothetical protein